MSSFSHLPSNYIYVIIKKKKTKKCILPKKYDNRQFLMFPNIFNWYCMFIILIILFNCMSCDRFIMFYCKEYLLEYTPIINQMVYIIFCSFSILYVINWTFNKIYCIILCSNNCTYMKLSYYKYIILHFKICIRSH